MTKIKNIVFDMDGTLVDSKSGIVNAVLSTLHDLKVPAPNSDKIQIGPPIAETLLNLLPLDRGIDTQKAIEIYRVHYATKGIFESHPYSGIEDLLQDLKSKGYKLYVATTKAEIFAKK